MKSLRLRAASPSAYASALSPVLYLSHLQILPSSRTESVGHPPILLLYMSVCLNHKSCFALHVPRFLSSSSYVIHDHSAGWTCVLFHFTFQISECLWLMHDSYLVNLDGSSAFFKEKMSVVAKLHGVRIGARLCRRSAVIERSTDR